MALTIPDVDYTILKHRRSILRDITARAGISTIWVFGFLPKTQKPKTQIPWDFGSIFIPHPKKRENSAKSTNSLRNKIFLFIFMMILGFLTGWNGGYHNYWGKGDDWIPWDTEIIKINMYRPTTLDYVDWIAHTKHWSTQKPIFISYY